MKKLYHKEVYWKDNFDKDSMKLVYSVRRLSKHLMEHLNNADEKHEYDLKGISRAFNAIKGENKGYIFEVEEEDGRVTKAVIRVEYDSKKDICLVVRHGIIATAWVNYKNDKHFTLDKTKYSVI